jgi:conjugal transfer pilus assembly protein TraL
MEESKYQIPRYIDEPTKIILWTIDEFLALTIPFAIVMFCLNSPITGVVIGALAVFLLKKLKGEQGHYFIYNLMYWYLPEMVRFKSTPPSYIRDFLG